VSGYHETRNNGLSVIVFETRKNINALFALYNQEETLGTGVIKDNPNGNG